MTIDDFDRKLSALISAGLNGGLTRTQMVHEMELFIDEMDEPLDPKQPAAEPAQSDVAS